MGTTRYWFLDFDDTLASGPTTWGLTYALPKLIEQNQLPLDRERFDRAVLDTQKRVAGSRDIQPALNALFDEMGWPHRLQAQLVSDLRNGYQPELFADVLPFLERLRHSGGRVYVISNNPIAPASGQRLGMEPFVERYFTPETCPGVLPKPDPGLWNYVTGLGLGADPGNSIMIGDDPWSDGVFAEACGLPCWIIDRIQRFEQGKLFERQTAWQWATSLLDIPI